jgi:hypothetical protein
MIVISNLSQSYITEVTAAETSAVIGGYYGYYGYGYGYSSNYSTVDIEQTNAFSSFSSNGIGSVNVNQYS